LSRCRVPFHWNGGGARRCSAFRPSVRCRGGGVSVVVSVVHGGAELDTMNGGAALSSCGRGGVSLTCPARRAWRVAFTFRKTYKTRRVPCPSVARAPQKVRAALYPQKVQRTTAARRRITNNKTPQFRRLFRAAWRVQYSSTNGGGNAPETAFFRGVACTLDTARAWRVVSCFPVFSMN